MQPQEGYFTMVATWISRSCWRPDFSAYVQVLDGHTWRTMIGMRWRRKWTETWKMHTKISTSYHGLRDRWLRDLVLQRKPRLEWIVGPLLLVSGIRTRSGGWIFVTNIVDELVAQRDFHSSWSRAANYETWSFHEKTFVQWYEERWCLAALVSHVIRGLTRTGIACACLRHVQCNEWMWKDSHGCAQGQGQACTPILAGPFRGQAQNGSILHVCMLHKLESSGST